MSRLSNREQTSVFNNAIKNNDDEVIYRTILDMCDVVIRRRNLPDPDGFRSDALLTIHNCITSGEVDPNKNPWSWVRQRINWIGSKQFETQSRQKTIQTVELSDNLLSAVPTPVGHLCTVDCAHLYQYGPDTPLVVRELQLLIIDVVSSMVPPSKRNVRLYWQPIAVAINNHIDDITCVDDIVQLTHKYYHLRKRTRKPKINK